MIVFKIGFMSFEIQVSGSRCSTFSRILSEEILHGVSLTQLHKKTNITLCALKNQDHYDDQDLLQEHYVTPGGDEESIGASISDPNSSKTKAVLLSNMMHDWLF